MIGGWLKIDYLYSMSATVAVMAILRRYVRIFRKAGATSPSTAIRPPEHGVRNSMLFQKLVRQGVLVKMGDDRYYLDETREAEMRNRRQKAVIIVLAILVIGLIIGYFSLRQ